MKKFFLTLTLAICLNTAFASDSKLLSNGEIAYYLFGDNNEGTEVLELYCFDAVLNSDTVRNGDITSAEESRLSLLNYFSTDVVLFCSAKSTFGDVSFSPTELSYVVNGLQYTIENNNYSELNGFEGLLEENEPFTFVVALPEATRGEFITLYYDEDAINIFFNFIDWSTPNE